MSVSFTWLSHSTFTMNIDGHSVLFDPFFTGNPLAAATPESLNPEVILISHGHSDHVADAVSIATRTNCEVIANVEVAKWLAAQGVKNTQGLNLGGSADYGFLSAKLTLALHSSSLPDGSYGGEPNGFVITTKASGKKLYFAGDTALFSDMSLIGEEGLDVAFLPIGDYYTMGVSDSVRACQYLKPRYVVPMHYNTFGVIVQNAAEWAEHILRDTNAQPVVLDPGGSFTLPEA